MDPLLATTCALWDKLVGVHVHATGTDDRAVFRAGACTLADQPQHRA